MDELRALRYVLAVADELSFSRAAGRLGVAQPTLSRAVRAYEDAHGIVLFDRTTRSVEITPALAAALDDIRATLDSAGRALDAARGAGTGQVRIGYVLGVANGLLPDIVRETRRRAPRLRLDLQHMSVDEQVLALRQRRIDLALLRLPADVVTARLVVEHLAEDELVLAAPSDHPLATAEDPVDPALLRGEPIAFWPRGMASSLHDSITDQWMRAHGFGLRFTERSRDTMALLALVAAGEACTLVTASTAAAVARAGVTYRRIARPPTTTVAMVHRRAPSAATSVVIEACLQVANKQP
ncbi:LysR family transcriptional regulator [Actinomycetes bacterium KLBMP 9759]